LTTIAGSPNCKVICARPTLRETRQVARGLDQNGREETADTDQAAAEQKSLPESRGRIEPDIDDVPGQPWGDQSGGREHCVAQAKHGSPLLHRRDFADERRTKTVDDRADPEGEHHERYLQPGRI